MLETRPLITPDLPLKPNPAKYLQLLAADPGFVQCKVFGKHVQEMGTASLTVKLVSDWSEQFESSTSLVFVPLRRAVLENNAGAREDVLGWKVRRRFSNGKDNTGEVVQVLKIWTPVRGTEWNGTTATQVTCIWTNL